jgi:preprotein translocase subunit SecA
MNKAELELHAGSRKGALRGEGGVAFRHGRKSHEADLTEKGRNFLSPKDPDAFVLPDLTRVARD